MNAEQIQQMMDEFNARNAALVEQEREEYIATHPGVSKGTIVMGQHGRFTI